VRGERGVAGGVVAQGAQLGVEAAEVVDRLVPWRREDDRNARRGMRRDGDDARGRPNAMSITGPSSPMKAPATPGSRAIIGEPCETKSEGSGVSIAYMDHQPPGERFNPLARTVRDSCKFCAR
jgi:hypothetical protein